MNSGFFSKRDRRRLGLCLTEDRNLPVSFNRVSERLTRCQELKNKASAT